MSATNKCQNCNRKLGRTLNSRYRHYAKHHPERIGAAILGALPIIVKSLPALRAIGAGFGRENQKAS